jgi:hypothetical protein
MRWLACALPKAIAGRAAHGRDPVIRIYRPREDLGGTHFLFISPSEKKRIPMILASLRGSSALTVADTSEFLNARGMIQFLNGNNSVRFAIKVDATGRASLKLSSKLLSLAKVLEGIGREASN